MATPATPDRALILTRQIPATAQAVFDAWTTPAALHRWFAPSDQFQTPIADVDLRVGGRYRIGMIAPDGSSHIVSGHYTQVLPAPKLVFTWKWETPESTQTQTIVTLDFAEQDRITTLTLTHTGFPNPESRAHHEQGWMGVLDRLQRNL